MLLVINVLGIVQLQFVSITRLLYSFRSPHDHDHVRQYSIKSDESKSYAQNAGASTKRVEVNIIRMNFYVENVLTYPYDDRWIAALLYRIYQTKENTNILYAS